MFIGESLSELHWTGGTPISIWIRKDVEPGVGAMRYAYKARIDGDPKQYRAKAYKDPAEEPNARTLLQQDIQMLRAARFFVEEWRKDVISVLGHPQPDSQESQGVLISKMLGFDFVDGFLAEMGSRHYMIEEEIPGNFVKFNTNTKFNYPSKKNDLIGAIMNAFSHHTYLKSSHEFVVCDLQGLSKVKIID